MIGPLQIGLALLLIGACALLSWWKDHRIGRDLLVSTLRTILQLLLLGYVLEWIFAHTSILIVLTAGLFMTINSAIHSTSRVKSRYKGLFLDNLTATVVAIWPLAYLSSFLYVAEPWWKVDHFLPLLGMLLGNTLNSVSMGIDHFTHEVREKKEEVISWLALGATTREATLSVFQRALRISMTPSLNSMVSMGLVSIPGMMTGQILAGASPQAASLAQMLIMILVALGSYLGTLSGLVLSRRRLFNQGGQPCF